MHDSQQSPPMTANNSAYDLSGKISFMWFGTYPRVILKDPELVREVLSDRLGHFQKPKVNPLGRLLVTGVLNHEGLKWAKHRGIINPAFHLEKLKVVHSPSVI